MKACERTCREHGCKRFCTYEIEYATLILEADVTPVTFQLQSDCTDLDLSVVSWADDGTCPGPQHAIASCDASNHRGWDEVLLQVFQARSYVIGVDGKGDNAGTFRLKVDCVPILRPEERVKF